jgi:D-beta-D-heptose 7-phosphate kinase/D-beta-D-heptose 1-phosphate adenosyltransferase
MMARMDEGLLSLIGRFSGQRLVVLGEAMLDTYMEGPTRRLCREAPVPVVDIEQRRDVPGGAANTAVNAAALGADVVFLSATGSDMEGSILRASIEGQGVATDRVLELEGRRTLAKHRILAGGQMVVRYDQGSTDALDARSEGLLTRALESAWHDARAILVSDYDYGLVSEGLIEALARLQARDPRVFVVDARRPQRFRAANPTIVKPNFEEAALLLGLDSAPARRAEFIEQHREQLLESTGAMAMTVTLDREGAIVIDRTDATYRTAARSARHAAVAGAGDTFASVLALALAADGPLRAAADVATAAATVVVGKEGTAVCSQEELAAFLSSNGKALPSAAELEVLGERARREGRRVVFTNGCFDILHSGHIGYLAEARALGDLLVVGVNSDASVRRLKGPERPINSLGDRLRVLGALDCIEHLVAFEEDSPEELIRALRPDVFVKGGDYTEETLPEAPLVRSLGGEVTIVPSVDDRSTTRIIDRIRASERGRSRRRSTGGPRTAPAA